MVPDWTHLDWAFTALEQWKDTGRSDWWCPT